MAEAYRPSHGELKQSDPSPDSTTLAPRLRRNSSFRLLRPTSSLFSSSRRGRNPWSSLTRCLPPHSFTNPRQTLCPTLIAQLHRITKRPGLILHLRNAGGNQIPTLPASPCKSGLQLRPDEPISHLSVHVMDQFGTETVTRSNKSRHGRTHTAARTPPSRMARGPRTPADGQRRLADPQHSWPRRSDTTVCRAY